MSSLPSPQQSVQVAPPFGSPWVADQGDGSYRNPILHADYSDPDVVRHGDDFWLTASSFNCTPGLPILHSRDLVNWQLVNHALNAVPGARYQQVQPGCGVWAPAIRFHAGRFWIFFATPDEGIYVTTAADPQGKWSEPHLVQAGRGLIDPCPLWDDDGQAYLVHAYAGSRAGIKHRLRVCPLAPDGSCLWGEGQIVFHEPERHPTLEGPKFLRREGWYYILAPAGGVATGWQTVLRSRHIYGPYEDRIVLQQGNTDINGPHQGALVDTGRGDWWFMHFQDAGLYGRIMHLQPVTWREGWPMMGQSTGLNAGEPVCYHPKPNLPQQRIATPATSDEFSSSRLGLQWQWQANAESAWFSLAARDGWLRLPAQLRTDPFEATPQLLLQKFPAREFRVTTFVDFSAEQPGDEAGLVVMGRDYATLAFRRTVAGLNLIWRTNSGVAELTALSVSAGEFCLQVNASGVCEFSFLPAGSATELGRKTFQATAGTWIGAKVGLYASREAADSTAHADVDYFRFAPRR